MQQLVRTPGFALSVISRIELLGHRSVSNDHYPISVFVQQSVVLPLDEPIILETIRLRQLYRGKLPDIVIGATALVRGLTLLTRNVPDFANIAGLTVRNPHDAASLPPI